VPGFRLFRTNELSEFENAEFRGHYTDLVGDDYRYTAIALRYFWDSDASSMTYYVAAGLYPATKITIHIYKSLDVSFERLDNVLYEITVEGRESVTWKVLSIELLF
jgi:hypothetical protein